MILALKDLILVYLIQISVRVLKKETLPMGYLQLGAKRNQKGTLMFHRTPQAVDVPRGEYAKPFRAPGVFDAEPVRGAGVCGHVHEV